MNNELKQTIFSSIDFRSPLLLCVSGGKDSACMLHAVSEFIDRFDKKPEVVHFNHGLREESKEEEEFVVRSSAEYGMKCTVFSLDVKGYARENGLSTEEAARKLRYAKLTGYTYNEEARGIVFTAHTATDQLETIVFRLIKGTGLKGLSGIRKQVKLDSSWVVNRPMLGIPVSAVMEYVTENSIEYREDSSNSDITFLRNFIRARITPEMRQLNPSVESNITKQAAFWAAEDEYLDSVVRHTLSGMNIDRNDGRIYIELDKLLRYNEWLQRRLIRALSPVELDFAVTVAVIGLVNSETSGISLDIGAGWKARKEYNILVFEDRVPETRAFEYNIVPGTECVISETGKTLKTEIIDHRIEPESSKNVEIFDAGCLNLDNIRVRSRRDGDRISLLGTEGTKKIKDVCIDLKLPLAERNSLLLVVEGDSVLWAAPHKRSGIALVGKYTKKILRLELVA
ncbi:MAG: tRNA lysidine(34) synthetase TilS [Elusimicrobiota bacterium]